MKFLLFCGDDYYPEGGADDLVGGFKTVEKAIAAHDPKKHQYDGGWANILDIKNLKIVRRFNRGSWSNDRGEPRGTAAHDNPKPL